MKSLVVAASAAALLALPGLAQAQETSLYGSIGYAHVDADGVNLGAVQGRLGARFGVNFGVEGEAAFGVNDDRVATGLPAPAPATVDIELKHQLGLFGVAFLPLSENVDLFARAGYTKVEMKGSAAGVSVGADDDGWAFGLGGQMFLDGFNGVRVDYTRHEYGDGGDANVWSVAYTRRF